jgi:hypothetical protein
MAAALGLPVMLPMWLVAAGEFSQVCNCSVVSCAREASGNIKKAAALSKSDHFRNLVRMSLPL